MKISTKTRYAVRGLIELYRINKKTNMPVSIYDISKKQDISARYLENIFFELKKTGFIKSIKGKNGGFLLNKKLSDIAIYDVMKILENSIHIIDCIDDVNSCSRTEKCIPKTMWLDIDKKIEEQLKYYNLEIIIKNYGNINSAI